jgi:hypothetical protein
MSELYVEDITVVVLFVMLTLIAIVSGHFLGFVMGKRP